MTNIIIYAAIMFITMIVMMIGTVGDFRQNQTRFWFKKMLDIMVVILNYMAVVALYNVVLNASIDTINQNRLLWGGMTIIFSLINLYIFASQIPMFRKYNAVLDGKEMKTMIISVIVGLFFSITEIYFAMYMINENWFVIDEAIAESTVRTAFEFIYFTFSVTITYSGSGIEVIGVVPKVFQMIHILFFYIFAGDAILQLLRKEK